MLEKNLDNYFEVSGSRKTLNYLKATNIIVKLFNLYPRNKRN